MTFRLLPEEPIEKPEKSSLKKIGQKAAEIARPYARTATNLVALGAGLPGDIASFLNDFVAAPISSAVTGQEKVPYSETTIGKLLPTSTQTKESLRSISPEYLSPKGKGEEFVDTLIEDTALLFSPSKTKIPFVRSASNAKKLLSSFTTSLGANLVGKGIEDISGGNKERGALTKAGALFTLSLINKPKAAQLASDLYKQAESALPPGAMVNASKLEKGLTGLKEKMTKGTIAPSEKFVIDEVDAVLGKIKNGKIPVEEAWAAKRSLNEKLNQHLFQNPEKGAQARARKLASGIQHELGTVIDDYGSNHPKFGLPFKNAEEAFGTIAKSKFITRFIDKNLKYSPLTSGIMHLFGSGLGSAVAGAGASAIGAGLSGGAAVAAAYPATQLAYRISKSPTLRKHYLNTIKAASAEDAILFNKELQRLDESIQKEQKRDKYRIIE